MLIAPRKALAISSYPDDVELGVGATISKLARQGAQIRVLVLSSAEESLPKGFSAEGFIEQCRSVLQTRGIESNSVYFEHFRVRNFASQFQDILERLVESDREYSSDTICGPSLTDTHLEPWVIAAECVNAFRTKSVFGVILRSHNDGPKLTFSIVVSSRNVENWELALAQYLSQSGRADFEPGPLTNLARPRALVNKSQFAEAFQVIRAVTA